MRATFSYASILYAVGQVLDQVGVKSIAVQEEEDGLFVEGFNSNGQLQVQLRYDIAGLYDLLLPDGDPGGRVQGKWLQSRTRACYAGF